MVLTPISVSESTYQLIHTTLYNSDTQSMQTRQAPLSLSSRSVSALSCLVAQIQLQPRPAIQPSRLTDFWKTSAPPSSSHSFGACPSEMRHEKRRVASSRTSSDHESISGSATIWRKVRSPFERMNLALTSSPM